MRHAAFFKSSPSLAEVSRTGQRVLDSHVGPRRERRMSKIHRQREWSVARPDQRERRGYRLAIVSAVQATFQEPRPFAKPSGRATRAAAIDDSSSQSFNNLLQCTVRIPQVEPTVNRAPVAHRRRNVPLLGPSVVEPKNPVQRPPRRHRRTPRDRWPGKQIRNRRPLLVRQSMPHR